MRYCTELGLSVSSEGNRLGDYDIMIKQKKIEVKMATEGTAGLFQFNHIRLDYDYKFIICLGVSPNELLFGLWSKADLATGGAGRLLAMGRSQNSSFKLTKRKDQLDSIVKLKTKLDMSDENTH